MPSDLDIRINRQGQTPTDDDLFWPEAMRQVQVDMMRSAQWAAASVLLLNLMGWSIVSAALLFGDVGHAAKDAITAIRDMAVSTEIVNARLRNAALISVSFWLLPLGLWTSSAVMALRAFTVRRYRYFSNSPDATRDAVMRIGRKKTQHLYWSIALWVAGVIALVAAVLHENI